jgi:translation initiation factor 1
MERSPGICFALQLAVTCTFRQPWPRCTTPVSAFSVWPGFPRHSVGLDPKEMLLRPLKSVGQGSGKGADGDLAFQIQEQGELVRALKADKADRGDIDRAVHRLLTLKAQLSGDDAPPPPAARSKRGEPEPRVRIEETRKGRGGKTATVITGLNLSTEESQALVKRLKAALSVGGRVEQDGSISIQGNHGATLQLRLQEDGYRDVKLAGGASTAGKKGAKSLAWNAPKALRNKAEEEKKEALRKKELAAKAERAARKSPEAVKRAKETQARKSEGQVLQMLEQLPASEVDKRAELEAKLARIRTQLG